MMFVAGRIRRSIPLSFTLFRSSRATAVFKSPPANPFFFPVNLTDSFPVCYGGA